MQKSGADVLLSNHTAYDGTNAKIAALRARKPNERHPFVIGNANILRYLTTADECAQAGFLATCLQGRAAAR